MTKKKIETIVDTNRSAERKYLSDGDERITECGPVGGRVPKNRPYGVPNRRSALIETASAFLINRRRTANIYPYGNVRFANSAIKTISRRYFLRFVSPHLFVRGRKKTKLPRRSILGRRDGRAPYRWRETPAPESVAWP